MINSLGEVIGLTRAMAVKKYKTQTNKLILLGLLAGVYIAMGGLLSTMVSAGSTGLGANSPIIPKLLSGATFPVGLMLVMLVGAELFTGNTAYLMPATLRGDIPPFYWLKNWSIVFVANFIGALLFDYFLVYRTELFNSEPYLSYVQHLGEYKISQSFEQIFLKGIGANWMVCLAVWLGFSSKDMLGRLVGIWWPVMAFVAIGFEHSIANMFYVPTAIFYGANIGWSDFLMSNLLPATLGNIVGGAIFVGMMYAYLAHEPDKSQFPSSKTDTECN